jgi:hypothetical protein
MGKLGWGYRVAAVIVGILGLFSGVLAIVALPKSWLGGMLILLFASGCLYVGITGNQESAEKAVTLLPWWPF